MRKHTRRLDCISSLLYVCIFICVVRVLASTGDNVSIAYKQFGYISLPGHAEEMSGTSLLRVRAEPSGPFCVDATNVLAVNMTIR